jgi:hypothetical protein
VVLTWILVGAFVVLLLLAFADAWRDEMALQADKFTNRTHDMGADIGGEL